LQEAFEFIGIAGAPRFGSLGGLVFGDSAADHGGDGAGSGRTWSLVTCSLAAAVT
jgi:hypothetical protein